MVGISTFGCGRWSEVGNTERKAPDFRLFRGGCLRWFWGVLAGITAGVTFHPLGSGRGSATPQVQQPCQFRQSPDGDKGKEKAALQDAPAFTKRRPRETILFSPLPSRCHRSKLSKCTVQKLRRYNQREIPTDFSLCPSKSTMGKS